MKEIRRINKVVSLEPDINNAELSDSEIKKILGSFDSEPSYFQQVIRPMLTPGHENELVFWLKETGLIRNTQKCDNTGTNCSTMSWSSVRSNDMYQWKCNVCKNKKSIREDSVFNNVKCSFKDAIRIILGWCKGNDVDSMAAMLSVKRNIVGQLYKKSAAVAEKFIRANIKEWKIGGAGRIVLVNTYPEISETAHNIRGGRPILCLTEVQTFPQKYWLETFNICRTSNISTIKSCIVKAIKEIVKPGTVLIIPSDSKYCSYDSISSLKDLYPLIIQTSELEKHNTVHQNLLDNLQTIWRGVLDICEEAQYYSMDYIQEFIIGHMWRQKYGNTSFEMLVYQIGV